MHVDGYYHLLYITFLSSPQGLLVDSADREWMREAGEELFGIIESPEMEGVPVVVVANKQDLPGALTTGQVADSLGLHNVTDRKWFVQGACATSGDGVYEAMGEMARLVKKFQKR